MIIFGSAVTVFLSIDISIQLPLTTESGFDLNIMIKSWICFKYD